MAYLAQDNEAIISKLLLVACIRAVVSPYSGIDTSGVPLVSSAIIANAYKSKANVTAVINKYSL